MIPRMYASVLCWRGVYRLYQRRPMSHMSSTSTAGGLSALTVSSPPTIRVGATVTVIREPVPPIRPHYQYLLIQRSKFPMMGHWALPGGSVEWGEAVVDCAKRELAEECGVSNATIMDTFYATDVLPSQTHSAVHFVLIHALCERLTDEQQEMIVAGDDAAAVRWMTREDIATMEQNRLSLTDSHTLTESDKELVVPNVLSVIDRALVLYQRYYNQPAQSPVQASAQSKS